MACHPFIFGVAMYQARYLIGVCYQELQFLLLRKANRMRMENKHIDDLFHEVWYQKSSKKENFDKAFINWSRRSREAFIIAVTELKRDIDRDTIQEENFTHMWMQYHENMAAFAKDIAPSLFETDIPDDLSAYLDYERIALRLSDRYRHVKIADRNIIYRIKKGS
jgi:hypothetical protein